MIFIVIVAVQITLFCFGTYYLATGDVRASDNTGRFIEPARARLLGVILMLPVAIEFSAGVALGIWVATSGRDVTVFVNSFAARIIEGLITIICGLKFNSMRLSSPPRDEKPTSEVLTSATHSAPYDELAEPNPYESPRFLVHAKKPNGGGGKATASLVLGLISIVTWLIPLFGIPTTIMGLVLGIKGLGPQRSGKAIAGIVLSIIFLVLAVLNAAWGMILAAQGKHPLFPNSP